MFRHVQLSWLSVVVTAAFAAVLISGNLVAIDADRPI